MPLRNGGKNAESQIFQKICSLYHGSLYLVYDLIDHTNPGELCLFIYKLGLIFTDCRDGRMEELHKNISVGIHVVGIEEFFCLLLL